MNDERIEQRVMGIVQNIDKLEELSGDKLSDEDRMYMLYFGEICDNAGLDYKKDRNFVVSTYVPEYSDTNELIGAHEKVVFDEDLMPSIGGQVISKHGAVKLGKYIAEKLGVDIRKEIENGE